MLISAFAEGSARRRKRDVRGFGQFASPAERDSIYRRDNRQGKDSTRRVI